MFFDWKGITIVIAVIAAVMGLCAVDLSCSAKPAKGSTISRVKGELAAGKAEIRTRQADELARTLRDMRIMAKGYVKKGDLENARRTMAAAQELDRKIRELRGEK